MAAWTESVFWPAYRAAGMLTKAIVALPGCSTETEAWVEYLRPDEIIGDGTSQSTDHAIEYQHADLPTLREGVELLLEHTAGVSASRVKYRVRTFPLVAERGTGFFRLALLTREEC